MSTGLARSIDTDMRRDWTDEGDFIDGVVVVLSSPRPRVKTSGHVRTSDDSDH